MTLNYHLGSYKAVRLALIKCFYNLAMSPFSLSGILVHSKSSDARKYFLYCLFKAFCTSPKSTN